MNDFFHRSRIITIAIFLLVCTGYVISRYAKLAFTPVEKITPRSPTLERGSIVDRNGKPLAVQTNFYHIGVQLQNAKSSKSFAKDVAPILSMTENEINSIMNSSSSNFVYIKKKINQTVYDELKQITDSKKYNFVRYDKIPGRVYPEDTLASQLVGFMGDDGIGLSGIEYSMQQTLSPSSIGLSKIEPGKNVYLTIDANLQYKLEQVTKKAMQNTQAESIVLIAAEAKTGEILSYISMPSANLNEYAKAPIEQTIDRPAMSAFEPGSVFKIFTVGLLHDAGLIHANDTFFCDGHYERKLKTGETIRIKCLEKHGALTPRDALRLSCNDVLGQMSDTIEDEYFVQKIRTLGFGKKTGIELPGEAQGSVKEPFGKLWSARSKPTIAIGQEISVSALQMVQAATALADGGVSTKLTVIKKITNKDGSIFFEHQAEKGERMFSSTSASYVLSCMETTARSGTGSRANLSDISIGVKTGTAQMASKTGGYSDTDFISNCIAIFPVESPHIVLYIVIEKAKGETYAGRIVAPVIGEAADIIIDHLGLSRGAAESLFHSGKISIPPDREIKLGSTLPDFTGFSKRELLPLLENNNLRITINGNGWVSKQNPPAGTIVTENMIIELTLE